jgi:hypothetical protein
LFVDIISRKKDGAIHDEKDHENKQKKKLALNLWIMSQMLESEYAENVRKVWVSPYLRRKEKQGCYHNLLQEFAKEETTHYKRCSMYRSKINTGNND